MYYVCYVYNATHRRTLYTAYAGKVQRLDTWNMKPQRKLSQRRQAGDLKREGGSLSKVGGFDTGGGTFLNLSEISR